MYTLIYIENMVMSMFEYMFESKSPLNLYNNVIKIIFLNFFCLINMFN